MGMIWLVKYPASACTRFTSKPDGFGGREILTDLTIDLHRWFKARIDRAAWEYKIYNVGPESHVEFRFTNKRDAIRFRLHWPWCYSD